MLQEQEMLLTLSPASFEIISPSVFVSFACPGRRIDGLLSFVYHGAFIRLPLPANSPGPSCVGNIIFRYVTYVYAVFV